MLTILLATVCAFGTSVLLIWMWVRRPFHIAAFFALFATVDVFIPAIYWTLFGQVDNPEWLPILSADKVLSALTFYSVFFSIFILCIIGGSIGFRKSRTTDQLLTVDVEARLYKTLWVLLILILIKMGAEMINYGGIESWFWSRVLIAASNPDGTTVAGESLFATLPLRDAFQAVAGLGFYYRKRARQAQLLTYVFPSVALFLAMATFLRGTVLTCVITFIFAEFLRRQVERQSQNMARRLKLGPIAMAALAGFLSIYLYGAVRDNFRGVISGSSDTEVVLVLPTFITAGHGLLGVSHIVAEYGQSVQFLNGKTYFDMLLLPIPRAIYTTKPAWYGIDDITRGMGWPESTQSAVTMPGEAYANFGIYGLLVGIPFGLLFAQLQKTISVSRIRHLLLGPPVFFQMASVTNWMAFTGFMNAMPLLVILLAIGSYISGGGLHIFLGNGRVLTRSK